jgi:protein FRG1
MVKALAFKGDKNPSSKKRKRIVQVNDDATPTSTALIPTTAQDAADEDENWLSADAVTDLAGPVMLVMNSSEPVMSLACDQLGAVFASKVENMVEGVASSAEPHDVRQVFIVTRVVGSESDLVLKGCNGRLVLFRRPYKKTCGHGANFD